MAEPVNGTLKVTLVTAKGLRVIGDKEPTSIVRLRILNSDPKDQSAPPKISQIQVPQLLMHAWGRLSCSAWWKNSRRCDGVSDAC